MSDKINKIKQSLSNLEKQIKYLNSLVAELEKEVRKDYKEVPGIMGTFDGIYLVGESGEKYEVPANYAAKSRLVCGDTLKIIEDEGKQLFKQISKVERKKLDAVVNKKEGKWYALAETGSYRLSDTAVAFNNLDINDKVSILIPQTDLNAGFAALDKVLTQKVVKADKPAEKPESRPRAEAKPVKETKAEPKAPIANKPDKKTSRPAKKEGKEFVDQISGSGSIVLDEDDLR